MSDLISRQSLKQKLQKHHDFFIGAYGGFSNLPQNDKSRVDEITNCIAMVVNEPSVTIPSVENKGEWIPFSEELPPKGKKVHVSTFGIVTIGERTSEADEKLRLSILEPMNNMYKNIDPYSYQITHWQPLPSPWKGEGGE